jgi:deoxyribodipyrimidine photo-lyase
MTTLLWFRQDLRLADNPALEAALKREEPIIPVFIWHPAEEAPWEPGAASRWWLDESLRALDAELRKRQSRLIIAQGPTLSVFKKLLKETHAQNIFWNRRYEPAVIERDKELKTRLRQEGITVESFNSALLFEPWNIKNLSGKPFQVFTPFWRSCLNQLVPPRLTSAPKILPSPKTWPGSLPLKTLGLEPKMNWADGFKKDWKPGEEGAQAQLRHFVKNALANYDQGRDRPDQRGTSRLSPHLHFGEVGPRQIWHAAQGAGGSRYVREIGWREFAYHLLFHFPQTTEKPLRTHFEKFHWQKNARHLQAWQKGQTGYPLVDAGMRELWTTGWMHNRVRMVVGSFLVKHLRLHWIEGVRWFWDTLVDADLANNTLGWQWVAGCGADAAPYFRIFNPILQGEKFDPQGLYVKRWVPELSQLPSTFTHKPWEAPVPPSDYPSPLVDHSKAREAALTAWSTIAHGPKL